MTQYEYERIPEGLLLAARAATGWRLVSTYVDRGGVWHYLEREVPQDVAPSVVPDREVTVADLEGALGRHWPDPFAQRGRCRCGEDYEGNALLRKHIASQVYDLTIGSFEAGPTPQDASERHEP